MSMYDINLMGGTNRPRNLKRLAPSYVNLELALLRAADELSAMAQTASEKSQIQREINLAAASRHLRKLASDCGHMVSLHNSLKLISRVNVASCDGQWVEIVRTY